MKKIPLHLPHLHVSIIRLTRVVAWALGGLMLMVAAGLVWYSLSQWYGPLNDSSIPEEKLTQKREQLRVKDFEEARKKLEEKKTPAGPFIENPFE